LNKLDEEDDGYPGAGAVGIHSSPILSAVAINTRFYKDFPDNPTVAQHVKATTTLLMALQGKLHRAEIN
jgi:hypothetical protein